MLRRAVARPLSGLRRRRLTSHTCERAATASEGTAAHRQLIYEGKFASRLKWLRRVSISSTCASVVCFPLAFHFGAAAATSMPLVGQLMIAGTAIFTSLSSTIFLQTITSPYVAKLYEIRSTGQGGNDASGPRVLEAERINLLGNLVSSTFHLNQAEKVMSSAVHPFATFRVREKFFYVGLGATPLRDVDLQQRLTATVVAKAD